MKEGKQGSITTESGAAKNKESGENTKVVTFIRNHGNKLRLGKEFYSEDEIKEAEISFKEFLKSVLRWEGEYERNEYFAERQKLYGEKPPTEEEIKELLK